MIKIGKVLLPKNITKWFPPSPEKFIGKPFIIGLLYNYVFNNDSDISLTNIMCSKEFIKTISLMKKIFDNY